MKLIILACLAAVALARPQVNELNYVGILRDERTDNGDGNFQYAFETEDNTAVQAQGAPGSQGQSNMQGTYRFVFPDGTQADVSWTADENGFVAQSPLIPAMPEHVFELLRIAEEQRAQGITFDELGRRVN